MAKTIGNPFSWAVQATGGAAAHVNFDAERIVRGDGHVALGDIKINTLRTEDLKDALRKGFEDLGAARTDAMFLVLIYPIMGVVLSAFAFNMDLLPLLFPIAAGFALLGPLAAVGLYEISRRRERGGGASWGAMFGVMQRPNIIALVVLGGVLLGIFMAWMMAAYIIYLVTLGPELPVSLGSFASDVFTTGAGWAMIFLGCAVGFVFAAVVLAISVVSFPLLLDRDVGVLAAIQTSVGLMQQNPKTALTWGFIVAASLVVGSIPMFVGLILVLPVLGHATWHLYRRAVSFQD